MLGERLLVICYRRRMRLLILPLAACVLACAQPSDVHKDTLANGMKVLIQEDHNIPNVAMYFFFEIGSRNERPGITGISHFFEHMMFNGCEEIRPRQVRRGDGKERRQQQRLHHRGRHRVHRLVSLRRARADDGHGGGSNSELEFRSENRGVRARRGLLGAPHLGRQQQFRNALRAAARRGPYRRIPIIGR